jgi:hypothetical protein
MTEFELTLLRQRSLGALRSKAKRGELKFCLPVGFQWNDQNQIEIDPDRRIQDAVRSVFRKFDELGSVRQVLLWFRREEVTLPVSEQSPDRRSGHAWKLPVYNTIHAFITNPIYAGAYASEIYPEAVQLFQCFDKEVHYITRSESPTKMTPSAAWA